MSAKVKARRGKCCLRDIAQEIGDISPSTLSRLENGKMLDVETFLHICDWLQVAPHAFIESTGEPFQGVMNTSEQIQLTLRQDKHLEPEARDALVNLLKVAYKTVSRRAVYAQEQIPVPGANA